MHPLRLILWPFAVLYHAATAMRNWMYDMNIIGHTRFSLPVIGIGNLSTGGTGKTPMTIEVAGILQKAGYEEIAVLSRGYGRESTGYFEVLVPDPPLYGDEPSEIALNLPGVRVFVCENRVAGIKQILQNYPNTQAVILDDCFQHRKLECGLYILLNSFKKPFFRDWLLPMGNLRESRCGKKRADVIIVTKAPQEVVDINTVVQNKIRRQIQPLQGQTLFFTGLHYLPLRSAKNDSYMVPADWQAKSVLLITSIAEASPLQKYLQENKARVTHLKFRDHHNFTARDLRRIKKAFEKLADPEAIIVTTGKDLVKLKQPENWPSICGLPLYFIPQNIYWRREERDIFEAQLINYVRANQRSSPVPPVTNS